VLPLKSEAAPVAKEVQKKEAAKKEDRAPAKKAADQRQNQVLSVNREFKFVVVNLGLRDKIKIGDMLQVESNGKLVGRVKVDRLLDGFSVCKIVEELNPAKIQEGNLVRLA
jgi:hypothetical protein